MADSNTFLSDLVHLARLGLNGKPDDVRLLLARMARRHQRTDTKLAEAFTALLKDGPTRSSVLRRDIDPVPVDLDSRLQLVRFEEPAVIEPSLILRPSVRHTLVQIAEEQAHRDELGASGLTPTKSVLFTGLPGVGKTLAARWLAWRLRVPLLVLDLSAVMSSFLGRTGNNLRHVLDYAKKGPCILLLDEFDAIAKRRDDNTEVGELKRLVTVLLQEIDEWPSSGLLIAATNHPDLLDPAVWRRFEIKIDFPLPIESETREAVRLCLREDHPDERLVEVLGLLLEGQSYSEIERTVLLMRRSVVMQQETLFEQVKSLLQNRKSELSKRVRQDLATRLTTNGVLTQREAQELTGVSRDTIRKRIAATGSPGSKKVTRKQNK